MSARKTLILPVEIPRRELDARIVHGLCAVRRGWRVVIGSKAFINRAIWKMPRGIYLFTTFTAKRLFMARFLKGLGFLSQGWDEEGLVYADPGLYLDRRVSAETLARIDQVFAWGEAGARLLDEVLSDQGRSAIPLGNPRMDLLRPPFNRIYRDEVERIRQEYGRFVLLNTNFSSVNFIEKAHEYKKEMKRWESQEKYEKFREYRQFMFREFLRVAPLLAEGLPGGCHLVIRPHPAEDPQPWRALAERAPNVRVATEGGVAPWLFAARALVHCDCTTAVEARVAGLPTIAHVPEGAPPPEQFSLPNAVSHQARSPEELAALVHQALQGDLPPTQEKQARLRVHLSAVEGEPASERAVRLAEKLWATQRGDHVSSAQIFALRTFGLFRYYWKRSRRDHRTDAYLDKVFPPMPLEKFRERVGRFVEILKVEQPVKVLEIGENIFVLDAGM